MNKTRRPGIPMGADQGRLPTTPALGHVSEPTQRVSLQRTVVVTATRPADGHSVQHPGRFAGGSPARNLCCYCLAPHNRRARCCSDWCERKVRGRAAYITRSRNAALRKIVEDAQRRLRYVPQWRRIAMGDADELLTVFGTLPYTGTLIHGETLSV